MTSTVIGLFDGNFPARTAVEDLVRQGIDRGDVSLLTSETSAVAERAAAEGYRAGDAAAGAGTGAALGGLGGLLVGLATLAIPGVGTVIAIGPIAAALAGAGIGAATGGILATLGNLGVPEQDTHDYAEALRRGGTLVVVRADEATAGRAAEIMNRHAVVDIAERAAHWRTAGWPGFDPAAAPCTLEQLRAEREVYASRRDPRAGEPVTEPGLRGARDRAGRGVRAYQSRQPRAA
jgi:hypothetical protein